jgi:hypothetical protein
MDPARRAAGQARESAFMAAVVNGFAGAILGLPASFGVLQFVLWGNPKFVFPGAQVLCFVGLAVGLVLFGCGAVGFLRNNARKPASLPLLTAAAGTAALMALLGAGLAVVVWTSAVSDVLLGGFEKVALTAAITGVPGVAAFLNWRALSAAKRAPATDR